LGGVNQARLKPDIYALSSHTSYQQNKQYICRKYGVNLQIVHPHNPGISTTRIIEAIAALKEKLADVYL
jgi:hypothetical protein